MLDSNIKNLLVKRCELKARLVDLQQKYGMAIKVVDAMERAFSNVKSDELAQKLFDAEITASVIQDECDMVEIGIDSVNVDIWVLADEEAERRECQTDTLPPKT